MSPSEARGEPVLEHHAYELKLQLRNQLNRALQLEQSWRVNVDPDAPYAFSTLIHDIERALDESDALLSSAYRRTDEPLLRTRRWNDYAKLVMQRSEFRQVLDQLVSAYNERVESEKVFTSTEPFIRLGEQVGVFDGIIEAADILMSAYCGEVSPKYVSELPNVGSIPRPKWRGVVSMTLQSELEIIPRYAILLLPEGMKSLAQNLLTPLAHEACHYWVQSTPELAIGDAPSRGQFVKLLFYDFVIDFIDEDRTASPSVLPTFKDFAAMDDGSREEISLATQLRYAEYCEDLDNRVHEHVVGMLEEVFCDLYAWTVAGPAYFVDFVQYFYRPVNIYLNRDPFRSHPTDLARLELGLILADLYPITSTATDGWAADAQDWNKTIVDEHAKRLACEKGTGLDDLLKLLPRLVDEGAPGAVLATHLTASAQFRRVLSEGKYAERLHEFVAHYFDPSPVFFPDLSEQSMTRTYDDCRRIAEQLWFDARLVPANPRMIAAAGSVVKIIRRPFYPSDKFYHSILLSGGADRPRTDGGANVTLLPTSGSKEA